MENTDDYICLLPPGVRNRTDLYPDKKGNNMGYVELIDMMPMFVPKGRSGDIALVQGARVSYGSSALRSEKADKGLVEYLIEHYHTSPLEMAEIKFLCCCPLFVFNQLVRHRTACITGDAELHFGASNKISIKDFYNTWIGSEQSSGPKSPSLRDGGVQSENKFELKKMELLMCDEITGEMKSTTIKDIWQSGTKDVFEVTLTDGSSIKTSKDHRYLTIDGWKTLKEASGLHTDSRRVWRWDKRTTPMFATNNGVQHMRYVCKYLGVQDIRYIGREMTYDLHVNGPFHNFVCNGFIVHNSVNCVSRRYTDIPEDMGYIPELRVQSETNHQGSEVGDNDKKTREIYDNMYEHASKTYDLYKVCCDSGVGKEVARGAMPQNIMTNFVWKMDLHNFLKMVRLRVHHTAQKEIRDLVQAMYKLVKPKFPIACNAFEKFWLNSISLSDEELEKIRAGKEKDGNYPKFDSKRRQTSFEEKLKKLGLIP